MSEHEVPAFLRHRPQPVEKLVRRADAMSAALLQLIEAVPSVKGLPSKLKAKRLNDELLRRIAIAKQALSQ